MGGRDGKVGRKESREEDPEAGSHPAVPGSCQALLCKGHRPARDPAPSWGGGIRTYALGGCRRGGFRGVRRRVVILGLCWRSMARGRQAPAHPIAHAPHRPRSAAPPAPPLCPRVARQPLCQRSHWPALRARSAGQRGSGPGSGRRSMPPSPDLPGTRSGDGGRGTILTRFLSRGCRADGGAAGARRGGKPGKPRAGECCGWPDTPEAGGEEDGEDPRRPLE